MRELGVTLGRDVNLGIAVLKRKNLMITSVNGTLWQNWSSTYSIISQIGDVEESLMGIALRCDFH